ncbi:hypothetical protein VB711_09770 [Cronbergia sp. UHCC 0137]|uniref:hypothetical protein n=1 Tax=Cronbergia sp. UHCC 0137 TaxID=3110239 RepID=UPI002B207F8E|nr:hypothetical protein [Cronbergia sp. UHCC 0137]MEA5618120.1 hypothetical protein [Cronbergia sp. UHCC 0137]
MNINLKAISGFLALLATSTLFPSIASADTKTPDYQTTNEVFERAYFRHDRNFYDNNGLQRQIDSLFGPGSKFQTTFTDNEIAKDAELINTVYRDVLAQQTTNDPYLRSPDLPNPYDSSLLMSPRYNANKLKIGTEYRFEIIQP